ncbi:MAG: DUF1722 domain-containing protein [Candidatus Tenebribacter davisii]|nr:DUF1722 domain-containing protein [Candidatus Tenebribacter davisii]
MNKFPRPKVVVSKCIEFASCRYNGSKIASPIVLQLQNYVDFIPVCPEVEIGLGIPREAVRLVMTNSEIKLLNSSDSENYSTAMQDFSDNFLKTQKKINGFILKSRSPSCGIKEVKLYPGIGRVQAISSKSKGIFGNAVLDKFGYLPVEDEGRLTNLHLREQFLTKLYTFTDFEHLTENMAELVNFHAKNKYLFMSYNQAKLKLAGKIVANHDKLSTSLVFYQYRQILYQIFNNSSRISSNINVLLHILGYFSKQLSGKEKAYFLDQLETYRNKQIPLVVLTAILQSWVLRFDQKYLLQQTYFEPFPRELMHITDSGKGRIIK